MSRGGLYGAAAGLALLLASNLGWWAKATGLEASLRGCEAQSRVAATERAAWKAKATDFAAANRAGQNVVDRLRAELEQAQGAARSLAAQGQRAIASARADATAAEQRLSQFRERYAAQRAVPTCAAVLADLQRHCKQFEGY
jgi:chromosome segregation ATPase